MDDASAHQLGRLAPPARAVTRRDRRPLPAAGSRPQLTLIVTPPDMRARWLRWVAIRQSVLLTVGITAALISATLLR